MMVWQGDQIRGVLENKPNEQNKRDLEVKISYKLEPNRQKEPVGGVLEFKMC